MEDTSNEDQRGARTEFQESLTSETQSPLSKYMAITVGEGGLFSLLKYELFTCMFGSCPGAIGYALRKFFYRRLIGTCGSGVVFGRNVTIRHPARIHIGSNVIIDDNVVLDAKGGGDGITLGDNVMIARNTILSCKGGSIKIGDNTNIGMNCLFQSESAVDVGPNIVMASYCYLVGGGNHGMDRTDIPIIQQPPVSRGGITIEENCWLGARATVIDGVTVGRDSVLGAGAVAIRDVPEFSVAAGIPAKVIKNRRETAGE
jgi:acetyltransferase-like isoleucine patch superfamily enzyme